MKTNEGGLIIMQRARRASRAGGVIVYTAIVLFVLVAFVGLAIDWGYMTWTAQKLQLAADAAALAGAQKVFTNHADARTAALSLASQNEAGGQGVQLSSNDANNAAGDVVIGHFDTDAKSFTPTTDASTANAVKVVARRTTGSLGGPLRLFFGPIFGKSTSEVDRFAIAVCDGGPAGNSIIALDPDDPSSFYMHGNPLLDLGGGNVQVNSNHNQAVRMSGTPDLIGTNVNIVGFPGTLFNGYSPPTSLHFNGSRPYVADPLAGLPEPNRNAPGVTKYTTKIQASGTYNPGYYTAGLSVKGNSNVFLNPGVYIFDNGVDVKANARITGYNVMIFIRTGSFEHNGGAPMILTPLAGDVPGTTLDESIYNNIQIFQSRSNTTLSKMNGNGTVNGVSDEMGVGTLYFPAAKFELGGTNNQFRINSIIAKNIEVYGTGDIFITRGYETTDGGDEVYLVE